MRLYRLLLRLYPASFRAEYADEMAAVFRERRRRASGPLAGLALWAEAFADILANALRVHGDILRQDLRYTVRTFRRSPGFAATAILVAALGVGAATAAFSITDHVLIRPLPFPDPERLVVLWQADTLQRYSRNELSPANYRDWKHASSSFDAMGAHHQKAANLVGDGEPVRLEGRAVTADVFPLLGARPALGRIFTAVDDAPGAPGTLVLSDRLWRGKFGADPSVLGRKVLLDGSPFVVIGVMPPQFRFPSRDTEFWAPMRLEEGNFEDRTDTFLRAIARLKPGTSLAATRSEMRLIARRLETAYPKENAQVGAFVNPLREEVSPQSRLLLKALAGASLGVLLIACANLANLLLARALGRRRELAVRTAMGAGRERLIRQLITESLVLALLGGALGVLLAVAAAPLLARLVPNVLPVAETPAVDLRMLGFAALLTIATGLAFGVAPALRAGNESGDALKEGARSGPGRRTERLRSALVIAEVTASVALLVSSGLLIRALWRLQGTDPGFRTDGVLTLRTALPMPKYQKTEDRARLYDSMLAEVRRLPGVSSAAYISFLPMVTTGGIWPVTPAGQPPDPTADRSASLRYVTPGFFATLGIPLSRGRDVADTDTGQSPFVAVVSESFARQYWPGKDPVGQRFGMAIDDRTVVGVVGDIRVRGLERASEPQVYVPVRQVRDGNIIGYVPKELVVRSSRAAGSLLPEIRQIVARADRELPISNVRPLAEIVDGDTAPRSVQIRILAGFAVAAFLLAGIGIHGLLAFAVSQRSREIGVRIALGAQSADILRMVLRQGALLAAFGVLLGVGIALAAGHSMQALLAGVSPADAPTFGVAVGLSFAMALLGSLVPALRAMRLDPLTVMRAE